MRLPRWLRERAEEWSEHLGVSLSALVTLALAYWLVVFSSTIASRPKRRVLLETLREKIIERLDKELSRA